MPHARRSDLVKEYRARLIADVVTGKLDTRETAARLPDLEPLAAEQDPDGDPQLMIQDS